MSEVRNVYNNPCLFATLSFNSSDNLFTSLAVNLDLDAILFNFSKAISNSAFISTINQSTSIKLLFMHKSQRIIESNPLVSIISSIFSRQLITLFSLSSCNKPSLTFSPSSIAFFSVSLLFLDSISRMSLCNFLDFFNLKIFSVSLFTLLTNDNSERNLNSSAGSQKDTIYQPSASYLFHIFFLISLPSFMQSLSVSLLFENILFHLSRSRNLAISTLLKNSILLANSLSSFLPSFGILITISGTNDNYFSNLKEILSNEEVRVSYE